jgi:hypothetical protein
VPLAGANIVRGWKCLRKSLDRQHSQYGEMSTMKTSDDRLKTQKVENSKEQPQIRLTETEPNEPAGTKTSAFRRLLNALWGPIRG